MRIDVYSQGSSTLQGEHDEVDFFGRQQICTHSAGVIAEAIRSTMYHRYLTLYENLDVI